MRQMDSAEKSLLHLPDEILEEILSRLSTNQILRLRCVSKSWRSLIGREGFIKTHTQKLRSNKGFADHRLIFHLNGIGLNQCSLFDQKSINPSPLDGPLSEGTVLGHCNGLLCVSHKASLFLWNPTTRISMKLPSMRRCCAAKRGFGWDERSGAYKVFAVMCDRERFTGKVYSSKTKSWKTMEHGCLSLCNEIGVFACGKIHWLTTDRGRIESLDLKSEVFGTTEVPFVPFRASLREVKGCLSVLRYNKEATGLEVWAMKELWEKVMVIPLSCHTISLSTIFEIGPNGHILLICGPTFLVYDAHRDVMSPPNKIMGRCCGHHVYFKTLVSPLTL